MHDKILQHVLLLPFKRAALLLCQEWMLTAEAPSRQQRQQQQQRQVSATLDTIAEEDNSAVDTAPGQDVTVGYCLAFVLGLEASRKSNQLPQKLSTGGYDACTSRHFV